MTNGGMFVMAAALRLCSGLTALELRRHARQTRDAYPRRDPLDGGDRLRHVGKRPVLLLNHGAALTGFAPATKLAGGIPRFAEWFKAWPWPTRRAAVSMSVRDAANISNEIASSWRKQPLRPRSRRVAPTAAQSAHRRLAGPPPMPRRRAIARCGAPAPIRSQRPRVGDRPARAGRR